MKRLSLLAVALLFGAYFLTGCGEKNEQTENKEETPLSKEMNTEKDGTETPSEKKEIAEKEVKEKDEKMEETADKTNETADKNAGGDVKMVTAEFNCSGMTCTGCEKTITGKVKKLDGVTEVKADHKSQLVQVTFDEGKTNEKEIEATINGAGYKCERKN